MKDMDLEQARARLIALLRDHEGADEPERSDVARMLAWAETSVNPFSRAVDPTHFTASAVVLDGAERICLVHHARLERWLQPGGHFEAEDGGDPVAAALREAREETGCACEAVTGVIDVDVHPIPARGVKPAHVHLDLRIVARALDPASTRFDPKESLGVAWYTRNEAIALARDPALVRLLRKACKL